MNSGTTITAPVLPGGVPSIVTTPDYGLSYRDIQQITANFSVFPCDIPFNKFVIGTEDRNFCITSPGSSSIYMDSAAFDISGIKHISVEIYTVYKGNNKNGKITRKNSRAFLSISKSPYHYDPHSIISNDYGPRKFFTHTGYAAYQDTARTACPERPYSIRPSDTIYPESKILCVRNKRRRLETKYNLYGMAVNNAGLSYSRKYDKCTANRALRYDGLQYLSRGSEYDGTGKPQPLKDNRHTQNTTCNFAVSTFYNCWSYGWSTNVSGVPDKISPEVTTVTPQKTVITQNRIKSSNFTELPLPYYLHGTCLFYH